MTLIYYYFLIINILSFLIYGIDKYKAKKSKNRISERSLLFLSLIGGCYGSIFVMNLFSHKTQKTKFITINYLLIIIYTFVLLKVFIWK